MSLELQFERLESAMTQSKNSITSMRLTKRSTLDMSGCEIPNSSASFVCEIPAETRVLISISITCLYLESCIVDNLLFVMA